MRKITDVINFSEMYPFCFMASSDNHQARVRPMTLLEANESGFYFHTFDSKGLFTQLLNNRNIEVCFNDFQQNGGNVLRITDKIEFIRKRGLLTKLLRKDPILKYIGITEDSPDLVLFRIKKGNAFFWNMDNLIEKVENIPFDFPQKEELDERYETNQPY